MKIRELFENTNARPNYMFQYANHIEQWLSNILHEPFDDSVGLVNPNDLTVELFRDFEIEFKPSEMRPFLLAQFSKCHGDFTIVGNQHFNTLLGCPFEVDGVFRVRNCHNITNLEHIPQKAKQYCLYGTEIKDFTNIDKHIKSAEAIAISQKINSGLLYFLKIKNLEKIIINTFAGWPWDNPSEPLNKAVNIINKHMKSKDVIACQRELIENDLDEFAEL